MFYTRTFVPTVLALCGFALLSASDARCDIIRLEPIADTFIISNDDGAKENYGSDPILIGYNDGFTQTNMLLQFNIANMQAASIRSARLCLWSTGWMGDYQNTATTSIFAVANPWEEQEVNWYYATNGRGWKKPGGSIIPSGLASSAFATNTQGMTIPSGGVGMLEWDVTSLVRLWANGTLRNNGLRIDTADSIFLFESRESLNRNLRPTLIIDYMKYLITPLTQTGY